MNVFTTDHPMVSEPSALARRVQRGMLCGLIGYLLYALLIGPLGALACRGYLDFVPESLCRALFLPVKPMVLVPGLRQVYGGYLDWWYHDPGEPYSSPDWM